MFNITQINIQFNMTDT